MRLPMPAAALFALAGCGWNGSAATRAVSLSPAPPPVRGGTIVIGDAGATIVVVDRDRARVDRLERTDEGFAVTASFETAPTRRPERAVLVGHETWIVRADGAIMLLDRELRPISEIPACASPYGLAWDEPRARVWVTCTSGEIVIAERSGNGMAIAERGLLAPDLGDVMVARDRAFVARTRDAEILILDAATLAIAARAQLPPIRTRHRAGDRVDVARGALRVVPDGDGALVLHQRARSGPPIGSGRYGRSELAGPCSGAAVHVGSTHVAADGSIGRTTSYAGVPYASDLALGTGMLALAVPSSFVDGVTEGSRTAGGHATELCAATSDAGIRGQVVAVAMLPNGTPIWQTREPSAITIGATRVVLDARSARDTGHDLFHVGSDSRVPCIACHLDGGDDGHVWELAAGAPRRTMSLRLGTPRAGGLVSSAPFHWDGALPDLDAVFAVHFPGHRGTTLARDQIDAFAAWSDALSAREPPPLAPELAARGEELFRALGCASCHGERGAAPVPESAEIADGSPWQVPSLVELGERAPYGHAGCASDFDAMLTARCGGAAHAVEDPDHIDALAAYLGVVERSAGAASSVHASRSRER